MSQSFFKEVCTYFQNFLETDFKSRRAPKRNLNLKDKAGNLTGLRLEKYPSFQSKVFELINSENVDFQIEVPRNKYTANLSDDVTDLIIKKIIKSAESSKDSVINDFIDSIETLFIKYEKDSEIFIQESLIYLYALINKLVTLPALSSIEGTIKRLKGGDEEDSDELSIILSNYIVSNFETEIKDNLKLFFIEKNTDEVKVSIEKIFDSKQLIKSSKAFFLSFSITDIHSEFAEFSRSKKLAEGLELYLYFGEIVYNKVHYPLFFVPIDLTDEEVKKKKVFKVNFDTRYFINKSAIEYVYQQINEQNTSAQISNIIGDRVQYVDEGETLSSFLDLKTEELLSHLSLSGNISFKSAAFNVANNTELKINNKTSIALFDKADESALNDYEELIKHLEENSKLGEIFSKLLTGFIDEEPEQIIEEVLDEWDETDTSDRLVFSSPIPLNEEQRKILSAINNSKSKFITVQGPPGTGKSHTITAILFEAILKDKSVLMLSDKKEALDVVEDKITQTLDTIRINENFQNPILRLGRQGATFSKILTTKNLDMVRTHLRAAKGEIDDDVVNSNKDSIKQSVNNYIDGYQKIKSEDLHSYLSQKNDLKIDDVIEEEISNNVEYIKAIGDGLLDLKTIVSNNEIIEPINNNECNVDGLKDYLQVLASTISLKNKQQIHQAFYNHKTSDKKILQTAIANYKEVKSKFFAFLFSNSQLAEWNKDLNERLDIKEYIDFRKPSNYDFIENYYSFLTELEILESNQQDQKFKDLVIKLANIDFASTSPISLTDSIERIVELGKKLATVEKMSFLKNVIGIDITSSSNIFNVNYDDAIEKSNKYLSFASLKNSLEDYFVDIQDVNIALESRQIQQDATAVMANKFDSRFIEFVDKNKTKAQTLKKIISKKQKFPRDDLELLRNAFPCIIAGIRDYADYIPLEPEIFDLIVIDEASQVSIAQAFPAIMRAKKIVVMGDKRQFSNVKSSNASRKINSSYQDNIRQAFKDSYGNDPQKKERSKVFDIRVSILEFFENIANYDCLLKKHFRGYPEIISFSSKYFYDNELQAIKVRAKPIEEVVAIKQVDYDGLLEIDANTNKLESDYIVEQIIDLLNQEKIPSVGVITPMKAQQKLIYSEIENAIGFSEMEKLNLKVMTFDSCQGEERDIIFYSFVDTPDKDVTFRVLGSNFDLNVMDPEESLRLQRLNVGMSRAKEKIELVISKPIESMKGNVKVILKHYEQEIENAHSLPEISELDSPMEVKVLQWIKQSDFYQQNSKNIELKAQFEIGKYLKKLDPRYNHPNYRTDFLMTFKVGDSIKNLVIEYDGFTEHFVDLDNVNEFNYSHYYNEADIEREKTLEAYGFPFLRLNRFNLGKEPSKTISKKLISFFLAGEKIAT